VNSSRRVVRVRVAPLRIGVAAAGVALALAACSATNPATIATPFDPADGRGAQIGGEQGQGNDGRYSGNGGIKLRNFLIVSQGQGRPGVVVGAISNDTGDPAQVTLTVLGTGGDGQQQQLGTTTVNLQPGAFVQLGNPPGPNGSAGASGSTTSPTSSVPPTPVSSIGSSVSTSLNSSSQSVSSSGGVATEPAQGQVVWFQVKSMPQPPGSFIQLSARTPTLGGTSLDLPILPPVNEYANITPTSPVPSTTAPAGSATGSGSATSSPGGSSAGSPSGSPQPSANPSGAAHQPSPSASR
jgi:hypothetical protein